MKKPDSIKPKLHVVAGAEGQVIEKSCPTYWAKLYLAGPIEVAKQIIRAECLREGLCVTIEPTQFLYSGGEEAGYVVGFANYPRFPKSPEEIRARARSLLIMLIDGTYQHSGMLVTPDETEWVSKRPENA